jgi:hypothetical protein
MLSFDAVNKYLSRLKPIDWVGTRALRYEKIRLERVEQRLGAESDRLKKLKWVLFLRGMQETETARLSLAWKIKELDARARARDVNRSICCEHVRFLSRRLEIKEREELRRELYAASPVNRRLQHKLAEWVRGAIGGQSLVWDQVFALRDSDEWAIDQFQEREPDKDLRTIVEAMEDARRAAEAGEPEAAAHTFYRIQAVRSHDGSLLEPV